MSEPLPFVIDAPYAFGCAPELALTNAGTLGNLGVMAWTEQRLDPDRRRRRLQLLAALADAKSAREWAHPERLRGARLRELIASRRRLAN